MHGFLLFLFYMTTDSITVGNLDITYYKEQA